ncbi:hypothetical protein ABPG74_003571 [Tetrahymena malaccensis]
MSTAESQQKDKEVLKDIELASEENNKVEEPSELEKRYKMTKEQKRQKALKEQGHNKFEDEDEREFDSQGLQSAQHGESVLLTLFPSFSIKSWTCFLILIQLIGSIILYIHVSYVIDRTKVESCPQYFTEQQIRQSKCLTLGECAAYELGGRYTPALTQNYQYPRLFLSLLTYDDVIQLFMNIFTQMIFGFVCENYYGAKKYLFTFFFVGIVGNFFGILFKTQKVYAGASASIYGLYGMNTIYMIEHYAYMGENRKTHVKNFAWIIIAAFMLFLLDDESDSINLPFSYCLGIAVTFTFINTDNNKIQILKKLTYLLIFCGIGAMVYFITTIDAQCRKELAPCTLFKLQ